MTTFGRNMATIAGILSSIGALPAQAQERPVISVRLARNSLALALRAFALQSGYEVSFSPAIVRGKKGNRVSGRMPAAEAMRRLLAGTGLTYRRTQTGFSIAAAEPPSPAPPPTPAAEMSPTELQDQIDVLVVGTRLDGGDALDVKRRLRQSASILTAADVERIPDTSLADVVRRLPGVQISASGGGAIISIRGLTQVETRINGRNLANTVGRSYDMGALPSDVVSGIDVYKTPSASQIEGGVGGVIDLHTRRPFDFAGAAIGVNVKTSYVDLAGSTRPFVSGYVSDRRPFGGGEVGVLLGGSYQRQGIAQDVFRVESNAVRVVEGSSFDAPVDATKRYLRGFKELVTAYASAQWRESPDLDVTGDFLFNRSNLGFFNASLTANLAQGRPLALQTFPESGAVIAGTFADVPLRASASQGGGVFDTYQTGLNGRWRRGALTASAELSYTFTDFRYGAPAASLSAIAPTVGFDGAPAIARFEVGGIDPATPVSWRTGSLIQFAVRQRSAEWAYRADAIYSVGGALKDVKLGVRFDRRSVLNRFASAMTRPLGVPASTLSLTALTPDSLFGRDYPQPQWLTIAAAALRPARLDAVRLAFGAPPGRPAFDPERSFDATEKIYNAYAELNFGVTIAGVPVDGDAGMRYARTTLAMTTVSDAVQVAARTIMPQSYDNWLPSVNVRASLVPARLLMRLSFSKQITRPPFTELAPTTTLDFVNATGTAGNPSLGPVRADQYDAALEWYFGSGGNLYLAGFYKEVSGLVRSRVNAETIDGRTFLISRPQNIDRGWIGGVEAGYQQRFAFLPGALAGLGVQASITFVDSTATDNGAGYRVPFQQLSRNNYAVALTYDRLGVSGAINWVWRDRLVEGSSGDERGRPLYRNPYGQLDAMLSYALSPAVSVTASVINALRRRTVEYFADRRFLNQIFREDRRFFLGVMMKLGTAT